MKKALKIVGIIFGAIFGLVGVATAVAAISGAFSHPEISIESLSWETDKIRVVEDFEATVNFLPENANQLDVELNLVHSEGGNVVEFPKTVKAGEPFKITLKKDENGRNIGGEVVIQAKTQLVVSQTNLKILVDVPIPNDGLVIASDFDTYNNDNTLDAGASDFSLYVFTNPTKALNPNTGSDIDLEIAYKNIEIKSGDTNKLRILDNGTPSTGFYCPDYIAHGHTGPFKNANGQKFATTTCDKGSTLIPYKYIEYTARALESTGHDAPVIVTAKALRTYDMQEQYVDKANLKYYANGEMTPEGRQQFLTDLSNYVAEFQDYLKTDTRVNYDSINSSTVNYESGAAFIEAITQTNINGEKYIKIEDNRVHEEAAYFYLFVESRTLFNIEQIEIADVQSSYETSGRKVEFNLFEEIQQYDVADLKTIFDVSLKPSSDEFSSSDLEHRLKELRVMVVMNKVLEEGEEDPYPNMAGVVPNNYVFEIENPTTKDTPIWKIRCINSIKEEDKQKVVRLRFYIPSTQSGEYVNGNPYADVPVQILINDVNEFKLYDTGATALATQMVTNTADVGGSSYRQVLDGTRYVITGNGNQAPTYSTVKFFVTSDSAKTIVGDAPTNFFKAKLSNDGNPALLTMTSGSQTPIEAYEVSYQVAGKTYLEAINVTDGYPLVLFAAVIKTDHRGMALDTENVPEDDPNFNGNYQIIRRSSNSINISINYYLEKLNFYTVNDTGNYLKRNVPETGSGATDTVQLLAGSLYTFKVSPYELTESGEFNAQSPLYSDATIDYQTNLKWAANYARNYGLLSFKTDSKDISLYENNYDTQTACYDLKFLAEINKNASAGYVADAFDYRVIPTGVLYNTFSSARSTVNMVVNYAVVNDLRVYTSSDVEEIDENHILIHPQKDYYVLSPVIEELTDSSDPGIKWRDSTKKSTEFYIAVSRSLDIFTTKDGNYISPKIDSHLKSDTYVSDYVSMIMNPNATDKNNLTWKLEFDHEEGLWDNGVQIAGGVTTGMKVEDFMTISQSRYNTVFSIKKGTPLGVFIKATCTFQLYQTNTGYIETITTSINFILKQSAVEFEMYSPFVVESEDVLVVNQAGENAAFVLDGGGNDGVLPLGYDLLGDYGTSTAKRDVYEWKNNDYVEVTGKQSYKLINAILDDDGELAGWCTYAINNSTNSPIYFLNDAGEKTYTAMPKKVTVGGKTRFRLVVYAEHISTSSSATITITDPFNDRTAMFNIFVKSSITLSKEKDGSPFTGNIETRTTNTDAGKIDLSAFYKARQGATELETSFVFMDDNGNVTETNPYATIVDGKYLIPKEVLTNKVVKIAMYYTLDDSQFLITQINNTDLAALVTPGYQLEVNTEIQNAAAKKFSINSGIVKDFYAEYAANPTQFIRIKNLATSTYIPTAEMQNMLTKLIRLSFDENALSASELAIFNTLFASTASKNAINYGRLETKAITNNIVLPIRINFLEGAVITDATTTGNEAYVATFYIEVKASVAFIRKAENIEGETYDTDPLIINGQEITNTALGHIYTNINVDKDADGQIDLGQYNITLFDSAETPTTNVLSLRGDDGIELLNSAFISYVLFKFDEKTSKYVEVVNDYNVAIITTTNEGGLNTLVIAIKNAVNAKSYYKLAIKTSVNKEGETFDYFFTVVPTYQLKVNYPIVTGPEKITAGATIDLFGNFINTNKRYQVYRTLGVTEFVYSLGLDSNTPNLYTLTTTDPSLTETVLLNENETMVNFKIVEGAGYGSMNGSRITFGNPGSGSQIVTVRITLFNGAYIDYQFELFASLNIPAISIAGNGQAIEVYAGNSVNILEYISANSTPDGFKFIIKYNNFASVEARVDGEDLDDANAIIDYSGNQLLVEFDDVDSETLVSFGVWHTYSVDGNPDSIATLNIKLLPNLQVKVNKTNDGKNVVNELVAGVETQIVSQTDTTWLKVANDDYTGISIDLTQVDGVAYDTSDPANNTLGVLITPVTTMVDTEEKTIGFKFVSKNIGVARNLVFTVTKTGELTYQFNFEIMLVPNIKLNSAYVTGNTYSIMGAAGADVSGRQVTLNSLDGVFAPKDYSGNNLLFVEDSGKVSMSAQYSDAYGNPLATDPYALKGAIANKEVLNITVSPVNREEKVFIKVMFTWTDGVEPYEAVLGLVITPNLADGKDADQVKYTGSDNYLPVFAGSTIELNFTDSLEVSQSGKTATVIAKQTTASETLSNVNIVLNINAHDNSQNPVYYELYTELDKHYIFFRGVPSVQTIEIPIYYDLTGQIKGLKSASEINFADTKIIKNSGKVIRFRVSPSMMEIAYKDSDKDYSEESNPINMTHQLLDLYKNSYDGEGNIVLTANQGVLVSDGLSLNSSHINSGTVFESRYTWLGKAGDNSDDMFYNVNAYDLLSLFSFTPETGVTFTTDPTKIYSELRALYSSINYVVTGKIGRAIASTDQWEVISRPEQYYTIDKERGIIYIIPPKQVGSNDSILLKVDLQLPGKSGATATKSVYLKLQFAGEYQFDETTKVNIGEGGEIINTYNFAQQTTDVLATVTTAHGVDLNATTGAAPNVSYVTEYRLDDYFYFGYLLRSYEEEDEFNNESKNASARYAFVQRGKFRYKYYLMDNISISYRFTDNKSADFASLEVREDGTYLIPNVYFYEAGADIRTIQIEATAGSISKAFRIYIHPRNATHNFRFDTTDTTKFVNNLTTTVEGEVPVYSSTIEILQEDLLADEYELVQSWLTLDETSGEYTFAPDLNQLKSAITVKFKNTISVDSAQNQIFEAYTTKSLTPNVGLTYNKADGVDTELTTTETPIVVGASGITSLFDTKVFALSNNGTATNSSEADYYNVSLVIAETNEDAEYAEYVRFVSADATQDENGLNIYTITNISKIHLLPNQILLNVQLPFTATLTFTNNGKVYTLVHNFNLLIKANAGITNLQDSYIVDAAQYSALDPTIIESYTERAILNANSTPAFTGVKVIGTGITISFEVISEGLSVSGSGIPTANDLKSLISFDMPGFDVVDGSTFKTNQAGEQQISQISMNFNGLFGAFPELTSLNKIMFNVVYTVDGESTVLKTITLMIQNGFKAGHTA